MIRLPAHLAESAAQNKLIPFIGAGFSRVFNLPTWSELIDVVSTDAGFDSDVASLYGDYLQLAEYLSIKQGGLSNLRSKLDRKFNSDDIDISTSEAHILLTKLKLKKIYTTNWDSLIERAFKHCGENYNKIVTFADIQNSNPKLPSIVKFHGDFQSNDDSLVFTESNYFNRLDFESALDIYLRADMLGNTLLFLGYSLSDFNVRYMWYKLQRLLEEETGQSRREPFAYVVMAGPNPIFEYLCANSGNIGTIMLDPENVQDSMIELLNLLSVEASR